jgi:ABC-type transport system involved in cytochrome bd biosynthesis fused ATPase/permease subunit
VKERPHVVLDDAVAEKTRNSWIYRLRSSKAFNALVAFLCFVVASIGCYVSESTNDYGLALCVVLVLVSFGAACWMNTGNDLEPLTSTFSLNRIAELAADHPKVSAFVSDAMAKGNTLRARDLRAAYLIELADEAQKASEYDRREAEEAAKVRAKLAATYGPAAAKGREE